MTATNNTQMDTLFEHGAHFGYSRSRRHPSVTKFLYGSKDRNDIFDLEQTARCLEQAKEFVAKLAAEGKQVLFVGGKSEAAAIVKAAAEKAELPYVAGRWIGGTLTNFEEIRKRVNRLEQIKSDRERGELEKYTKRERMLLDREVEELEDRFGGLASMKSLPAALFIVDTRHEDKAAQEANQLGIPVIGYSNSDCDFRLVQYPIPANDSAVKSVRYFVDEVAKAYTANKKPARDESQARAATSV